MKQWWNRYFATARLLILIIAVVIAILCAANFIGTKHNNKNEDHTYIASEMHTAPAKDAYDCNVPDETIHAAVKAQDDALKAGEIRQLSATNITYKSSTVTTSKIYINEALSADLQQYAKNLCEEHNFPLPVFMSLMWKESTYEPSQISSDNHDYGLCQIRDENFSWIENNLGNLDFMSAKDSMKASMFMFDDIRDNYGISNMHLVLMYYNMGPGNAKECINEGNYSSEYSRLIIGHAETLGYTY